MAEDVSEDTLTSALSLLVNLSRVLLQEAKKEAEGRRDAPVVTDSIEDLDVLRCFVAKEGRNHVE